MPRERHEEAGPLHDNRGGRIRTDETSRPQTGRSTRLSYTPTTERPHGMTVSTYEVALGDLFENLPFAVRLADHRTTAASLDHVASLDGTTDGARTHDQSTSTTTSRRGPWTPSTRSSSMSRRRRRAGDEDDRPALPGARLERGDELRHRLDDLISARTTQTWRSGTRVSARRPWPGPPSRAIVPVSAHAAAQVVSAPSSRRARAASRPSSSTSSTPPGRSAAGRGRARDDARRPPGAGSASADGTAAAVVGDARPSRP